MREIKGDLIALFQQGEFDCIAHGCNTQGIMGAGIALQISAAYNEVKKAYKDFCTNKNYIIEGEVLCVRVDNPRKDENPKIVMNCYTQIFPGKARKEGEDSAQKRLEYIDKCLKSIDEIVYNKEGIFSQMGFKKDIRIGFPLMGCGLAGLDWEGQVKPIFEKYFSNNDLVTIVYYQK